MARQWNVTGKYPIRNSLGNVESTVIQLVSTNEDFAQFEETVSGDHTNKSDSELIKLARDQFFKKEYSSYAVEDSVKKIDAFEKEFEWFKTNWESNQKLVGGFSGRLESLEQRSALSGTDQRNDFITEHVMRETFDHEDIVVLTEAFLSFVHDVDIRLSKIENNKVTESEETNMDV